MEQQLHIISEEEFPQAIIRVEEELEKIRHSGQLASFDGCPLHYEYYLAEKPRGSVVIVHGFTEFSKKYYELAWYFLSQGYHVFLHDLRGHGLSGRQVEDWALAHVDCYEDYVRDLEAYMEEIVCPVAGELPLYLFSHSMGCAISLLYLMEKERPFSKVILSSPMVVPVTPLPKGFLARYTARTAKKEGWKTRFPHASKFNPNPSFERSSDASESRFRRHIAMRVETVRYQNSSATNAWMYHTLRVDKKLLCKENLQKITHKVLLFQAGQDKVVKLKPQNKLAKRLPNCHVEYFPEAKHTIFNGSEESLKRYVSLVLEFLTEG